MRGIELAGRRTAGALTAIGVLAALALAASLLVGAAGGALVKRGGTLRIAAGVGEIDPAQIVLGSLYNTTTLPLVAFPDRHGDVRLRPAGAAAMPTLSADGRTYVFRIRRGLRFSDGTPVTARHYEEAFRRALDPRLDSYVALLLDDVIGARPFAEGKTRRLPGVRASGRRLVVRLLERRPDFLVRLAMGWITPTPIDLPVALRAPLPSAGPYYVREWERGQSAVLARNPYWRRSVLPWRPANVDRIVYQFESDDEAVRLVERGAADVGNVVSPSDVRALMRRYGVNRRRLFVLRQPNFVAFTFNHRSGIFRRNPRLRQAVNYALDRRALAAAAGPLRARPSDQLLMPGVPGYRDSKIYPLRPNVEKARALAAGHRRGGRVLLWTWAEGTGPWPGTEAIAQIVKRNLARIGLRVQVQALESNVVVERASDCGASGGPRPDMSFDNWLGDYPDPYDYLNLRYDSRYATCGGGFNTTNSGFREPLWDRRLRAMARRFGRRRNEGYARLERDFLRKAAPIAVYGYTTRPYLLSRSTGCFEYNPLGIDYAALCKR